MKRILVATDFSTRSDRAVRRAILLAKTHEASLTLLHVVDDDQPQRIVRTEQKASMEIIEELATTVREVDQVTCEPKVVLGDPFQAIIAAGDDIGADLIVMGEHRRKTLRDIFIGTTVERTMRDGQRPILMATAIPAGFYRHVLIAIDFSDASRDAVRSVMELGLHKHAAVSVVHTFDAVGTGMMARVSLSKDQIKDYVETMREQAEKDLSTFLQDLQIQPIHKLLKLNQSSPAAEICSAAREISADLIVVGTHDRRGVAKLLLGSVAEGVLRISEHDVLALPRRGAA